MNKCAIWIRERGIRSRNEERVELPIRGSDQHFACGHSRRLDGHVARAEVGYATGRFCAARVAHSTNDQDADRMIVLVQPLHETIERENRVRVAAIVDCDDLLCAGELCCDLGNEAFACFFLAVMHDVG